MKLINEQQAAVLSLSSVSSFFIINSASFMDAYLCFIFLSVVFSLIPHSFLLTTPSSLPLNLPTPSHSFPRSYFLPPSPSHPFPFPSSLPLPHPPALFPSPLLPPSLPPTAQSPCLVVVGAVRGTAARRPRPRNRLAGQRPLRVTCEALSKLFSNLYH